MFCPKCDHENPDNALYCGLCYEVLQKDPQKPSGTPSHFHVHPFSRVTLRAFILSVLFAAILWVFVDNLLSKQWYFAQTSKKIAKILSDTDNLKFTLVDTSVLSDPDDLFPADAETFFSIYNVNGHTFEQICGNLKDERIRNTALDKRIGSPTFTNTHYSFEWQSEPELTSAGARWKSFKIFPRNTVIYPVWNENQAIRNIDTNRWNLLVKILMRHEAGHCKINVERAKLLENELQNLKTPDMAMLTLITSQKKRDFLGTIQDYHDEYDKKLRPGNKFVKLHKKL
ncbi:MAG: DUF922 domain-containing protein [Elusimicrobiota bacterium]